MQIQRITTNQNFGMAKLTPAVQKQIQQGLAHCLDKGNISKAAEIEDCICWLANNAKDKIIYIKDGALTNLSLADEFCMRPIGIKGAIFGPKTHLYTHDIIEPKQENLAVELKNAIIKAEKN